MQRVLVTGAGGQLGRSVLSLANKYPHFSLHGSDREELPLDQPEKMISFLTAFQPDAIINCAAYTAVDKAEEPGEQALVYQVNAEAVKQMAIYAREADCKIIQVSTDYVFDGKGNRPYREDDPVSPVNAYGASKLKGEEYLLAENPAGVIVRTSWVYAAEGRNFLTTMLRLMKEKEKLTVVDDQRGTPTSAMDLANVLLGMLAMRDWHPGIYHYSNAGETTWFGFAKEINRLAGLHCNVQPITSAQFPTPAKRPSYSVLDKSKISQVFGLTIPDWKESLARVILSYKL
ncbi:dTDP-4-dehydrorhamnose reductase [Nostoc ellipsosporum NOK]|nr:dTDP-4-dehydrorhamnose reductase [Nostoc ellipsosporum NOK]